MGFGAAHALRAWFMAGGVFAAASAAAAQPAAPASTQSPAAAAASQQATSNTARPATAPSTLPAAPARRVEFGGQPTSPEARAVAQWAFVERDAQGRPFAVVDKKNARIHVFGPDGRLIGASAVLLGQARGDDSAPGIGLKPVSLIPPQERTTPAGRFDSQPGRNDKGEAIVWIDYSAAIAIHRLRPTASAPVRAQGLASDSPDDNRASFGCIVVSESFYDAVIARTLGRGRGVVYVLPETRAWQTEFGLTVALQL